FFADSSFFLPTDSVPAGFTVHLPYGSVPTIGPGNPDTTLVGLRRFSSPICEPTTGVGCPSDGVPVFSSIFAQDTVANSNYNSLQASLEKRMSHRSEEHTSELQSLAYLVCRLLLEKKKPTDIFLRLNCNSKVQLSCVFEVDSLYKSAQSS